jgi:hypothetical protein
MAKQHMSKINMRLYKCLPNEILNAYQKIEIPQNNEFHKLVQTNHNIFIIDGGKLFIM